MHSLVLYSASPGKGCMTVLMLRAVSPDSILRMAEFIWFRYTGGLCWAL